MIIDILLNSFDRPEFGSLMSCQFCFSVRMQLSVHAGVEATAQSFTFSGSKGQGLYVLPSKLGFFEGALKNYLTVL